MGKSRLANKHTKHRPSRSHHGGPAGNLPLLRSLERNLATTTESELRARLATAIAAIKVRS